LIEEGEEKKRKKKGGKKKIAVGKEGFPGLGMSCWLCSGLQLLCAIKG
jgi:hypothetical protein